MAEADWRLYRRNLPHLRVRGATYFVTWRLRREQPDLTPAERTSIAQSPRHFHRKRYELISYVIMNDHVHVIATPTPEFPLEHIVHSWKSFTTNALRRAGRHGLVWLDEYFDRVIRDDDELNQKVAYILNNPHKRWPDLADYPWACLLLEE